MNKPARTAIFFLLLFSVFSCKERNSVTELTLMTYNVGSFSKYENSSVKGVARVIFDSGATYISLNELDSCNRRHNTYQLKDLCDEFPMWSYLFSSAIPYKGGSYGNGILCKDKVTAAYKLKLPQGDGAEVRSVAIVETRDCVFAALHLDHKSQTAALIQIETLTNWFSEHFGGYKKPVFLCGDFNALPDSHIISKTKEHWTQLSTSAPTFSTNNPSKCIDYIFAFNDAKAVEVVSTRVIRSGTADLSDHFPVEITVKF